MHAARAPLYFDAAVRALNGVQELLKVRQTACSLDADAAGYVVRCRSSSLPPPLHLLPLSISAALPGDGVWSTLVTLSPAWHTVQRATGSYMLRQRYLRLPLAHLQAAQTPS